MEEAYCGKCNLYYKTKETYNSKCPKCERSNDYDQLFYTIHQFQDQFKLDDKLIYKDGQFKQLSLARELAYVLSHGDIKSVDFTVPSHHMSKSVDLPVPCYKYKDTKLMWRNNFHDTVVYMESKRLIPKSIMKVLIYTDTLPDCTEGMYFTYPDPIPKSFDDNPNCCLFYCSKLEWLFGVIGMVLRNEIKEA